MKCKIVIISLILFFFANGYSSPKDANKENFKEAIDKYLSKKCIFLITDDYEFPVSIKSKNKNTKYFIKKIRKYDALVKMGFLNVKSIDSKRTYSITDNFKSVFFKSSSVNYIRTGQKSGFCLSKYKVVKITNYSEATPQNGYTVSHVNFMVSPKHKWSEIKGDNIKNMLKEYPNFAKNIEENQNKTATLILMNDGWVLN